MQKQWSALQMRGAAELTYLRSPLRAALRDWARASRPPARLSTPPLSTIFRPSPTPGTSAGMVISDERDGGIAGEMLPQPDVLRADGVIVPLDDVLAPGFSLIGVDLEDPVLHRLRSPAWRWLDVKRVALILAERFPTGEAVSVADGRLTSFWPVLGANASWSARTASSLAPSSRCRGCVRRTLAGPWPATARARGASDRQ